MAGGGEDEPSPMMHLPAPGLFAAWEPAMLNTGPFPSGAGRMPNVDTYCRKAFSA